MLYEVIRGRGLARPVGSDVAQDRAAPDRQVDPDTIYRLAVDPAEHTGEDFVYLLDDGVLRFEADGRSNRTFV